MMVLIVRLFHKILLIRRKPSNLPPRLRFNICFRNPILAKDRRVLTAKVKTEFEDRFGGRRRLLSSGRRGRAADRGSGLGRAGQHAQLLRGTQHTGRKNSGRSLSGSGGSSVSTVWPTQSSLKCPLI